MGWYLHAIVPEDQLADTIEYYNHYIVGTILALVVLAALWFGMKTYRKKKEA